MVFLIMDIKNNENVDSNRKVSKGVAAVHECQVIRLKHSS